MKMEGRSALITGASSGIGKATALRFAREGARTTLVGRNEEALRSVARKIEVLAGDARTVIADVAAAAECESAVAAAVEAFGRLDVLVNAAGQIDSGGIDTTSREDWDAMMRVNVDAVFELMRHAVPHLGSTSGCIVNVSSVTGLRAFPNLISYCVAKAAVDQMTRCAALDLASRGIRVNAVNPGVVRTELHLRGGMDPEDYAEFLEHGRETHPLGRVGRPEEIADAILYLASDDAGWVTGVTLSVDGGRQLTCAR